ncbi:SDR family NAD(P)-dependent oxidoreductase [Streptomyces sp. NPDC001978]|uniref:SDR family NAD(P)-dependent oxidoreductase n=1 Tax=Streptomyces sp. NPDC001978 TaxID=3364627 RepID=UPI00367D0BF0
MASARVWLITGATGGLGRALVARVLKGGDRVVAAARNPQRLRQFETAHPERFLPVPMDVTDPAQVRAAVQRGIAAFGRLDVLVNNAGYAQPGALEELEDIELRQQFESNFFGPVNVLRAALPHLRSRRSGHILQISSIAGQIGAPGMSAYTSSKHALEGLSVSLAAELKPFGIRVTIVEPGSTRTAFRGRWSELVSRDHPISDYDTTRAALANTASGGPQAGDPDRVADALATLADLPDPPLRAALGSDALHVISAARRAQLDQLDAHRGLSISADGLSPTPEEGTHHGSVRPGLITGPGTADSA